MQFKSIEILGFKSFADKTVISFEPGVSAIVGPNGCGKSNIMDAIRWTLGEQSAKGLRGDKMEDIIFNGSSERKPLGMAEVTIKLLNRGGLPIEYNEIQITRRLYRSGESEYLLNKSLCRLKDITDLFLDTGMGHRAYSLVQQGKVDFLLSSKPEERRALIEEAAGVMKYKTRKKETLAKLELTRQNLLRIGDITVEVKRQLDALKRQAARARRYKKLHAEERSLVALLACRKYLDHHEQSKILQTKHQQLKDLHIADSTKLTNLESEKERLELKLLESSEELNMLQKDKHQQDLQQKGTHDRIQHLHEMLAEQTHQHKNAEADILNLQQQIIQAKENQREQQKNLVTAQQELIQGKTQLEAEEETLKEHESLVFKQRQEVEAQKNRLLDIETQLVQSRNRLQIIQSEGQKLIRRKEIQEIERKNLNNEHLQLKQNLEKIYKVQTQQAKQLEEIIARNQELQRQTDTNIQQLKQLDKEILAKQEQYNLKFSQLASLDDLQKNLEGFQEGVRHLLLSDSPSPGLLGLVAQLIETKSEYELAIETVLGPQLEYILVDKQSNALQAINQLEEKKLGRGSFIPKDLVEPKTIPLPKNTPSLAVHALDLITYDESQSALVKSLLGSVWLADKLEDALILWQQAKIKPTIVTLKGEIIDANGIITGGSSGNSRLGFLTRTRKLKELQAEIKKLKVNLAKIKQNREETATKLNTLNQHRKQVNEDQHQLEINLVGLKKDLQRWESEKHRQEKQAATLDIESNQLDLDIQTLNKEQAKIASEQEQFLKLKGKETTKLSNIQQHNQGCEKQLNDQIQKLTGYKVRLASLGAKTESIQANLKRLKIEEEQIAQRTDLRKKQKEKSQIKQQEIQKEIDQLQEQEKYLAKSNQQVDEKLTTSKAAHQERLDQLRALETNVKAAREEQDKRKTQIADMDVQLAKLKFQLEEVHHQIAPTGHSLQQLTKGFDPATFNPDEVNQKLEKIRLNISQLGTVNLLALEELEALQKRYDFLTKQQEDLKQSSLGLHEAINKINKTTKERFLSTFEQVNEKFKQLCSTLFEKGEGKLRLVDENDLLETGIEVMIRPAGKRLRQMTLLSGGEKTMAAIAFLFAIYLVKPSPLCFLDEVDAALDEANVGRLLNIINTITDKSQVVMITHNRKTMETANALYGITMETPGISKIVSVKIDKEGVEN